MSTASYKEVEALTRWASRVPDFTVTSTVPTHGATNVPVNQTINIVFPIAIDSTTANSTEYYDESVSWKNYNPSFKWFYGYHRPNKQLSQ